MGSSLVLGTAYVGQKKGKANKVMVYKGQQVLLGATAGLKVGPRLDQMVEWSNLQKIAIRP